MTPPAKSKVNDTGGKMRTEALQILNKSFDEL
jgi:hypothetical protein